MAIGGFTCVVEEDVHQTAESVTLDGEVFFVFSSEGRPHRTVIHARTYLEMLQALVDQPGSGRRPIMKYVGEEA